MVMRDFDQDSRPDLATAGTNVDSVSVLLSGGGAIPLPSVSTDALVFEGESSVSLLAERSPQEIRFSNIGLGFLRVGNIEISGSGAEAFAMVDNTCRNRRIHTGDVCRLQVEFMSQDSGTYHATLIIQDNASGSPRRVTLKGINKG